MASTINSTDTGQGGLITTGDSSDELQLQTAETTALTIDSSQNVGIGTSSPASKLQVSNISAYSTITVTGNANNGGILSFVDSAGSTTSRILGFGSTSGAPDTSALRFDTNGAEAARFNSSGNLVFPNGQGIDFSASAGGGATSSLLDDYEEGTFTPTLTPASGSTPLQGSYNTLSYTKIGRVVTITGQIVADTPSSATGTLTLGNLPFALANIDDLAGQARPSIHIFCNGGGAPATGYFSAFIGFSEGGTSGSIVPTYNATYDSTISDWIGVGSDIFVNFSYITT